MDTQNLIKQARARFQHQEHKLYLKEKYSNQLTVANQGGMWTITPELLVFLRTCSNETAILIDNFDKPVRVNIKQMLVDFEDVYQRVTESWYEEFQNSKSRR